MIINKKILFVLLIFSVVVISAGVVSASDINNTNLTDNQIQEVSIENNDTSDMTIDLEDQNSNDNDITFERMRAYKIQFFDMGYGYPCPTDKVHIMLTIENKTYNLLTDHNGCAILINTKYIDSSKVNRNDGYIHMTIQSLEPSKNIAYAYVPTNSGLVALLVYGVIIKNYQP